MTGFSYGIVTRRTVTFLRVIARAAGYNGSVYSVKPAAREEVRATHMNTTLLYATTNPGKLMEVGKYLEPFGLTVVSPTQLGITIEVEESGQTLEENAILKARAYLDRAPDRIVIADDTGVEIDALHGEPGIHVRRWRDKTTPLSDQEVIDTCIARMRGIPTAQRGAQFRTVIALAIPGGTVELFDGILRGTIVETPAPLRIAGFPFEALFYIPEWGKLLGEIHELSIEEKMRCGYLTHRERAVHQAIPRLQELARACC
jgi:XTP/dITP diphosphohydrolase